MKNPTQRKPKIRGGILLLGSLAWEIKSNKGVDRAAWRRECLVNPKRWIEVDGLPLQYGRRSTNRGGEYAMIFNPAKGAATGTAKFAELKSSVSFKKAAPKLAIAEGFEANFPISGNDPNTAPNTPWGLVALWINPHPRIAMTHLLKRWIENFPTGKNLTDFGEHIVSSEGLILLPWPPKLKQFDFCLCTPTRPNVESCTAAMVVTAMKAAKAVKKGGFYFRETYDCGIRTADDEEILRELVRQNAPDEMKPRTAPK